MKPSLLILMACLALPLQARAAQAQSQGRVVVESAIIHSLDEARAFAEQVPLPLVIRPAYTLGGSGGGVAMLRPSSSAT